MLSLNVEHILGDRAFAEVGEPALAVLDEGRRLVAVAGVHGGQDPVPVGVYDTEALSCRALLRAHHPVHAMAFHPGLPLLAIGTGRYDGGYFFEGQLILLNLETGSSVSLIEDEPGRQVLGLEWLDQHELRVLMAPLDDWNDKGARHEGHLAVVRRADWSSVPARSLTRRDLAGPRSAAPRPDGRDAARRLLSRLGVRGDSRRSVRAVEQLADGRTLATLEGVRLECWLPSGQQAWSVPDTTDEGSGGQDIVVSPDERSAWVGLVRPWWKEKQQSVVRLSLADGAELDQFAPAEPVSVVRRADGSPALAPSGDNEKRSRFVVRDGSRVYFREPTRWREIKEGRTAWLAATRTEATRGGGRPPEPAGAERLYPFSWVPGETHFAGPGVETSDGELIHAGTVHDGRGLQPGGSFVVRRMATSGKPVWAFRTDRRATALAADAGTVYVAYNDGEMIGLGVEDGSVRLRERLTVGGVGVVGTALTVTGPGRLLIGTGDGRVLVCAVGEAVSGGPEER